MPVLGSNKAGLGQEECGISLFSDYTSPVSMRSSLYNDTDPGIFLEIQ